MKEISVPRNKVPRELPSSFSHVIHPAAPPPPPGLGVQPPKQGEINFCCLEDSPQPPPVYGTWSEQPEWANILFPNGHAATPATENRPPPNTPTLEGP